MGIFDQMNKPGTDSRPGYFEPGNYVATLTTLRAKPSADPKRPRGTYSVIAEFLVATSSVEGIRPGDVRVYVATIEPNDKGDKMVADVKCLLFALNGVDPQNAQAVADFERNLAAQNVKPSDLFEHATGEKNPFAGRQVRLVATHKISRTSGQPFTVHTWTPAAAPAGG